LGQTKGSQENNKLAGGFFCAPAARPSRGGPAGGGRAHPSMFKPRGPLGDAGYGHGKGQRKLGQGFLQAGLGNQYETGPRARLGRYTDTEDPARGLGPPRGTQSSIIGGQTTLCLLRARGFDLLFPNFGGPDWSDERALFWGRPYWATRTHKPEFWINQGRVAPEFGERSICLTIPSWDGACLPGGRGLDQTGSKGAQRGTAGKKTKPKAKRSCWGTHSKRTGAVGINRGTPQPRGCFTRGIG